MTAIVETERTQRQRRVRHVAGLLDELETQRRHLYRLKAGGAKPAGLRDLKQDHEATRQRLLAAVSATV